MKITASVLQRARRLHKVQAGLALLNKFNASGLVPVYCPQQGELPGCYAKGDHHLVCPLSSAENLRIELHLQCFFSCWDPLPGCHSLLKHVVVPCALPTLSTRRK